MVTATQNEIAYEILDPEQWAELNPIFEALGMQTPHPSVATASVARDESGKIRGMLMLQLAYHAEPLWIDPAFMGKVSSLTLLEKIEGLFSMQKGHDLREYFVFTTTEMSEGVAELAGLDKMPWAIYRKRL
jgi:hypothetical protein